MKHLLLLSILFFCLLGNAQTKQELVYPVVPILDKCHKALDNADSIIILSKKEFLHLKGIWTTFDSCYNYAEDTLWAKNLNITFGGLMDDGRVNYLLGDGNLKSVYQSSLKASLSHIKSYDHIHIRDIQFERNGGLYQVEDIHIVIDSLVVPERDTCWQYFPMPPVEPMHHNIKVSKERFITLLTDSFGYNSCKNKIEWHDTNQKVEMWIAPRSLVDHFTVNSFINDYNIRPSSDLIRPINEIKSLGHADIIAFRRSVYLKAGKYHFTPGYRFTITDKVECATSINIEEPNTDFLIHVFKLIQMDSLPGGLCFVNSKGEPISFKAVMIPQGGNPSMMSSGEGTFNSAMIIRLKKLVSGDKILLEDLYSHNPHENKKSNYKSIVITLP